MGRLNIIAIINDINPSPNAIEIRRLKVAFFSKLREEEEKVKSWFKKNQDRGNAYWRAEASSKAYNAAIVEAWESVRSLAELMGVSCEDITDYTENEMAVKAMNSFDEPLY